MLVGSGSVVASLCPTQGDGGATGPPCTSFVANASEHEGGTRREGRHSSQRIYGQLTCFRL